MSKRDDIVRTAEALFYTEGFHRTGVARIARQASTTQRTLYQHFATKEQLILAVMQQREARYWAHLEVLKKTHANPWHSMLPFIALKDWLVQHNSGGCFYQHALAEYQGKDDEIVAYVKAYKARQKDDLSRRLVQDGIDQDDLLVLLGIIYEGLTALSAVSLSEQDWSRTFTQLTGILENARDNH